MRLGHRPKVWLEKLREQQSADAGRGHPPPRGEPKTIAETRCPDGRSRTNIGGKKGCEESSRPEASPGNQEVGGGLYAATDEDSERHQKDGIEQQGRDV